MLNCVAAIQFDEEKQRFVLLSGENRVEIRKTKALKKFVNDSPEISMDILAALKDQWFPDEIEDMNLAIAKNMLGWMDDRGVYGLEEKMEEYLKVRYPDLAKEYPDFFDDGIEDAKIVKEVA